MIGIAKINLEGTNPGSHGQEMLAVLKGVLQEISAQPIEHTTYHFGKDTALILEDGYE